MAAIPIGFIGSCGFQDTHRDLLIVLDTLQKYIDDESIHIGENLFQDLKIDEQTIEDLKKLFGSFFHSIAKRGDCKTITAIIEHPKLKKTFFSYKDSKNRTLLIIAAEKGHYDATKLISINGGFREINHQDNFNLTALMHATINGHRDIVFLLVANGADRNLKSERGFTALIFASSRGDLACVKILLESNLLSKPVDPDTRDDDGNTALIYAAMIGNKDILEDLLKWRANPNLKNYQGLSALKYAEKGNFSEIIAILKQYQPKDKSPPGKGYSTRPIHIVEIDPEEENEDRDSSLTSPNLFF